MPACGARTGLTPHDAAPPVDAGTDARTIPDAFVSPDSPDAGPLPCVPTTLALTPATPTVMLVLDRSQSMSTRFEGARTRWQVLTSALADTLPAVDTTMELGALVFPSDGAQSCSIPAPLLGPALDQVDALIAALGRIGPNGATPTADAIDAASAAVFAVRAASSARALVLATDGGPDCNSALDPRTCECTGGAGGRCMQPSRCLDDVRTVDRIAAAAARGLPTYVIGIADDTISTGVLDRMAVAGGRARLGTTYYGARSSAELESALTAIRDQVALCTYLTSSVPDAAGSIRVQVGDTVVAEDATSGWTWVDRNNGELRLSGAACDQASSTSRPGVSATIECAGP